MVPPPEARRELRRIPLPRTSVNKGMKKGRSSYAPALGKVVLNSDWSVVVIERINALAVPSLIIADKSIAILVLFYLWRESSYRN
jgi:hypothetical protein